MSLQTQPAVTHSRSPLERCSPEILERVVLSEAEERLPGPPSTLLPLLTTSKTLNFALSPNTNNSLYASIFALKFDTAALSRRFNERWFTSQCLSSELRHRFKVLNRIRRGDIDGPMLPRDLWTIFLLLLEHDYKNTRQLTEWAKADAFTLRVAQRWLTKGYGPEFDENSGGLVCRIIWELVREAGLTEQTRRMLQASLYIHVVGGHRISSFYASEEFYFVRGLPEHLEGRIRGHPPTFTQLQCYGHDITIAAPPLAPTCLSVFVLTMQPNEPRYTPGGMSEYAPGRTFSQRMDNEWFRLVMCYSINDIQSGLAGALFTPSSLIGSWKGVTLIPHFAPFRRFLSTNQEQHAFGTPINLIGWTMELREHHCLGEEEYLPPAEGPAEFIDNPLNAWIPRDVTFEERDDMLKAFGPDGDQIAVYETYRTDAKHPYVSGYNPDPDWVTFGTDSSSEESSGESSEKSSEQSQEDIADDKQNIPDETQGLSNSPEYVDDEGFVDTAEHRSSGITDIMVTGTMRSGNAQYELRGRVRSYDGLIILTQLPRPNDPPELNMTFRGYIHGEKHIIGRWKRTITPVGEIGWEGGFIFNKNS